MITYLNQIKETRTLLCSAEQWEEMTTSQQTECYIKEFRKSGDISWKQRLHAVNFHGYDPAVLNGAYGSRKQDKMQPTGLFMLDVDHIDNPKELAKKLKKVLKPPLDSSRPHPNPPLKGGLNDNSFQGENTNSAGNKNSPLTSPLASPPLRDVATRLDEPCKSSFEGDSGGALGGLALVHITPSGKGLRIVMRGRPGSNIKDDQAWLAGLLGVQHDECTKDLSRWSFVPMKSDILYMNPEILFEDPTQTLQDPTQTLQDPPACPRTDIFVKYR